MIKYLYILLLIPLLTLSQEITTPEFLTTYNKAQVIRKDGILEPPYPTQITMVFNYNQTPILKVYTLTEVRTYLQTSSPIDKKSDKGLEYQEISYKSVKTNDTIIIKLFSDTSIGLIVVFSNKDTLILKYE